MVACSLARWLARPSARLLACCCLLRVLVNACWRVCEVVCRCACLFVWLVACLVECLDAWLVGRAVA
eukprot:1272396-Alexandrium_andersonii.AAC.1